MTPTFITGATGFVGRPLLERLVAQGRSVRALARSPRSAAEVAGAGAEAVEADLSSVPSLTRAMDGAERVFHVAGVNRFCARDVTEMMRVNVDGSRAVVAAAAAAGVERVVYTSSAAVIGEATGTTATEDTPHRGWYLSDYERSKHLAEEAVIDQARRSGVEVVLVNPASVQGPGRLGGTARLFLAYLNRRLPVAIDTRLSIVDIDDCTDGHLLAEERARPLVRYLLAGAALTVPEAIDLLAELTGDTRRPIMLPPALARAAGAVVGRLGRLGGSDPSLCPEVVRTLLHGHAYDGSRAEVELGLVYTPVADTLARTAAWYSRHGHLRRPLPGLRPPHG